MKFQNNTYAGASETTTSTTANDYVESVVIDILGYSQKLIMIENTSITNSLTFKIYGYASIDGIGYEILGDTALVAGDVYMIEITKAYARIVLSAKSTVSGSHATFDVDYTLNRGS